MGLRVPRYPSLSRTCYRAIQGLLFGYLGARVRIPNLLLQLGSTRGVLLVASLHCNMLVGLNPWGQNDCAAFPHGSNDPTIEVVVPRIVWDHRPSCLVNWSLRVCFFQADSWGTLRVQVPKYKVSTQNQKYDS